ncbi:sigma-70 family RNA polymerase sigma factor [Streptomyces sp. bgisy034]|uniref:sigma-70 family RNA polymerase sigma factor n=1 Tax=Streptomyces sp. bgisy034 TaxID=3413774 RepID=UPI003EBA7BBD
MRNSTPGDAAGAASSDADLTVHIRSGVPGDAQAAAEELYRRHRAPVLAYARTCTRDSHTAEDLTSEAFARALRAVQGGSGPQDAWRPYLLTTVRRTAAAWCRTARRTELAPDFEAWLSEAPMAQSGEEWLLHQEEGNQVVRAFRSLPERWRTVLWHSAVEGESPERIAPLLGLSASGVASLTARAREGLREAYLAEYASDPDASEECRHYTGLLAASIRRAGRRRRHQGLERHLADCPRCRHASLELRDLNKTLGVVLPAGVLLWAGASYGSKAAGAGGAAAGLHKTASGMSTGLKAVGIGTVVLAISVGVYLPFRDGDEPREAPAPRAAALAPTSTPPPKPSESPSSSPTRNPTPSPSRPTASPPPSWSPAATDRTQLPIVSTGRCMDIDPVEGAEPYEAACDGSRTQQWELLVDRAAHEVRLRNYATGMCLANSGTEADGAPVRQQRAACTSTEPTVRWTYHAGGDGKVVLAQLGSGLYYLGLDDWHNAAQGNPHSPAIGTTANYYNTPSLRFRYAGDAFSG